MTTTSIQAEFDGVHDQYVWFTCLQCHKITLHSTSVVVTCYMGATAQESIRENIREHHVWQRAGVGGRGLAADYSSQIMDLQVNKVVKNRFSQQHHVRVKYIAHQLHVLVGVT